MESASRTIQDLSDRLTVDGFKEWYEKKTEMKPHIYCLFYI